MGDDGLRRPWARLVLTWTSALWGCTWLAAAGARAVRHDPWVMLEYVLLLFSLIRATMRDHEALVAENLLLRHQLAVLTRPARKRPRCASTTSCSGL